MPRDATLLPMTTAHRPYKGVAASDRIGQRRAALREACLEIVGEQGATAVSAEGVCRIAGLTKRYFYESYADRDALLLAILDEFLGALEADILTALEGVARTKRPRVVVDILVRALTADARVARLFADSPAVQVLRERRNAAVETYVALLRDHVLPFKQVPNRTPAHDVVTRIIVAGTTDVISAWVHGHIDADRTVLADSIVGAGLAIARNT